MWRKKHFSQMLSTLKKHINMLRSCIDNSITNAKETTINSDVWNIELTQRNYLTSNSSIPRAGRQSLFRSQHAWGRTLVCPHLLSHISIITPSPIPMMLLGFSRLLLHLSCFPCFWSQCPWLLYHRLIFCRKQLPLCDDQFCVSMLLDYILTSYSIKH